MSEQHVAVSRDFDEDVETNRSGNPHIRDILQARLSRRTVLAGGLSAVAAAVLGRYGFGNTALAAAPPLNFTAVPKSLADVVSIPAGYTARVLYALGDPIDNVTPAFFNDGTDEDYDQRAGDHHDGMSYFGIGAGDTWDSTVSNRGLLCINHENISQRYLHPTGAKAPGGVRPAWQVRKEMDCHGVGVIEIQKNGMGQFEVNRGSPFNRRITPKTRMLMQGPAARNPKLATKYRPDGSATRGTLNNCANGYTPWGTYLTCEENWAFYFKRAAGDNANRTAAEVTSLNRYGISQGAAGSFGWSTPTGDEFKRLDCTVTGASAADDYRNEPNNFGWVVEIDPFDPARAPRKRTALGRFAHEGAWCCNAVAGQPIVIYMGDDSRGEYMYKFVSTAKWNPADRGYKAGSKYLDRGRLYAAKFNADGTGAWLPLAYGVNGLDISNPIYPFANQGDVLINARLAADAVGATRMDRPEWVAIHPENGEVYLTLTNNSQRGINPNQPLDAANPRNYDSADGNIVTSLNGNVNGHIIRWRESDSNPAATAFTWDIYLFGSRTTYPAVTNQSALSHDNDFSSPDGAWFDDRGILWIQTDDGAYTDVTNCMMLAATPGQVGDGGPVTIGSQQTLKGADPGDTNLKRFLVGPKQCEITGICMTPDHKTMFVNIQHPGEDSGVPGNPATYGSHWPDSQINPASEARPRSATIVITKDDSGDIAV